MNTHTNLRVSFGNTTNADTMRISANRFSTLLEGTIFILQNESTSNIYQLSPELMSHKFNDVLSLIDYPEHFFQRLTEVYNELYGIILHPIVYIDKKYQIWNKNQHQHVYSGENHAFIWCNKDYTTFSPLYLKQIDERMTTIFKLEDLSVWENVQAFIEKINKELESQSKRNSNIFADDLSDMAVDNNTTVTNTSDAELAQQSQGTTTVFDFIGECQRQIDLLRYRMKPQLEGIFIQNQTSDYQLPNIDPTNIRFNAELILQRLGYIAGAIDSLVPITQSTISTIQNNNQENEINHLIESDLSNTIPVAETMTLDMTEYNNNTPVILKQPKKRWHYRNMKDLGRKNMCLLNGDGPQQTPIQIGIPAQSTHQMYLGVKVQTIDGQDHPYKLLVPKTTKIYTDSFYNDNDLNRLKFDECNSTDHFDIENRFVYLEISEQEHLERKKDVRVHMFNLYQSGSITQDLVKRDNLKECKLVFWLFTLENNVYKQISPMVGSDPITEG